MICTVQESITSAPIQHQFDPYTQTGGTSVAIAGDDFVVLGADTRQSEGYLITSRYSPKAFKLTDKAVFSFAGYYADGIVLHKTLIQRLKLYKLAHNKVMEIGSIAQMIQTILYGRRFFPYYTNIILAGLSPEGKGIIYNFDPVGSYGEYTHDSIGTGAPLLQPLMDNQVGKYNQINVSKDLPKHDEAVNLIKDGFISATERDIYTGDQLEIFTVNSSGVSIESVPLKRD
ncbi:proteasome subunit beta type [Neoconidiobolus thromboides FSU 785]|nr:proteasome subunit beta type [Neoconidiobolus thromboides FSU 785]